jgi:rhamnosyltransferase
MVNANLVSAIVVTYNPNVNSIIDLIGNLSNQVGNVIIVDNASLNYEEFQSKLGSVYLLPLAENFGIADAQNRGIDFAKSLGSESVILFDQDSTPPKNLVITLLKTKSLAERADIKIAAIGPFYRDIRSGSYDFYVSTQNDDLKKIHYSQVIKEERKYAICDFIISSGSLIDIAVLDIVGGMNSSFFIDSVDIEWCYRARKSGYYTVVDSNSIMEHCIGGELKIIWGRELPVHPPIRIYYGFRNLLYLSTYDYISPLWKKNILFKIIFTHLLSILYFPEKMNRIKSICFAILDFLRKKSGKCSWNVV